MRNRPRTYGAASARFSRLAGRGARAFLTAAIALPLLAGCAVGPDFHPPAAPSATGYTATPLPAETAASPGPGGAPQRFAAGKEIPAQWWTLFRSEPLDRLIRQALADSPTLVAAEAALRQARENRRARIGALFPSIDAGFNAKRQMFTGAAFGQPDLPGSTFTLYNASVNVSYALDLFGGTRRGLEELQAQVDYQRYLLEGAWLSLTANLVTTAVREATVRERIRATRKIVAAEEKQVELVAEQFRLGGASLPDLLAQKAQLAQTRATLPPLEKELAQTRHQLAVLAGKLPGEAGALPQFDLADLSLPVELPVALPSSLVRQRPDIRAAEEQLHAACAQVGVATANLFPQLTISGSYGSESTTLSGLFSAGSGVWSIGAGLVQPLFHGGELTARRRAAIAAYDQAAAQYRETVLLAFQNVADALRALDTDARTLQDEADAEAAARSTLELTQDRFRLGGVSYLTLLAAEKQYQQARLSLAQARGARFADTAALFQALGGGWWHREQKQ